MQVFNVIERDGREVFVYTFSTYDKAKEYFNECYKHLLRMNDCENEKELLDKFDLWEDSVFLDDDIVDIYGLDYELFIEEKPIDTWYDFNHST